MTRSIDEHQNSVSAEHHSERDRAESIARTNTADFRGFIGRLHSQVAPFEGSNGMHAHTDGTELLPWFRVMTVSDPQYVRGYTTGSWWLRRKNLGQAFAFVEEGLENNPDSFQIRYMHGMLLFEKAKALAGSDIYDPDDAALAVCLQARDAYRTAAELALKQRPSDYNDEINHARWTRYMEEDTYAAAHMAVLTEKQYGEPQMALALARDYVKVLSKDPVLNRILDQADEN